MKVNYALNLAILSKHFKVDECPPTEKLTDFEDCKYFKKYGELGCRHCWINYFFEEGKEAEGKNV